MSANTGERAKKTMWKRARYSLLSDQRKLATRDVAAAIVLTNRSVCMSERDLKSYLNERLGQSEAFSGIISSLLVSIAVKLAIELIKHWIFNKITPELGPFQTGEPGL